MRIKQYIGEDTLGTVYLACQDRLINFNGTLEWKNLPMFVPCLWSPVRTSP